MLNKLKAVDPLIQWFTTTITFHSGDGVTLFNTAHPTSLELYQTHLATQADLNETSLEAIIIDMLQMTDERGF